MRGLLAVFLVVLLALPAAALAGQGRSDYSEPRAADGASAEALDLEGCSACTLRHGNLARRLKAKKAAEEARGDCRIKGDITADGVRVYYRPGDSRYEWAWIHEAKGEQWFCSAAEAEAAGWRSGAN